ncbi:hypothetical protein OZL92_10315 [Bacillus sonorensis]|uniref:Uncharacterized protein n=2 Tax=Bacillus sonorensis TaxID=119858 RepID=M5P0P2_9BACI|nr:MULTISPECIES: hypothetical protein [Bacillus]TWK79278.1 hypothetical protein CHCC20335_0055 [Bacillus paralicheniformis]ASB90625.1 hypothetical protein S101395_04123 [Bacillus sonorensis]EME73024.1 hypothetical protein BSONL12_14839 [Bacillus sonorensis L12]MBG9914037.1 hypothetical protein [Bacillus sonorensis]MCY7857341.1 hypothetical protein [Bacillus sonorensis]
MKKILAVVSAAVFASLAALSFASQPKGNAEFAGRAIFLEHSSAKQLAGRAIFLDRYTGTSLVSDAANTKADVTA